MGARASSASSQFLSLDMFVRDGRVPDKSSRSKSMIHEESSCSSDQGTVRSRQRNKSGIRLQRNTSRRENKSTSPNLKIMSVRIYEIKDLLEILVQKTMDQEGFLVPFSSK